MKLTVILADDHDVVRAGIRKTLEDESGIQVVAESDNGRDAVKQAQVHNPDFAILDINMEELNGLDAAEIIMREAPHTKVLILSMYSDKIYVEKALKSGVSGYILKDCAIKEVVKALHQIQRGKTFLSPEIVDVVIDDYRQGNTHRDGETGSQKLTARENEVLQLLAEGKPSKEIAEILTISLKTVEGHRQRIMDKLNLRSIAELTKYAIREGITFLEK